ncbi:MAG: hemin uptake protein HemP [Dyella sp.]
MRSLPLKERDFSRQTFTLATLPADSARADQPIKRIDSQSLLDGTRELVIEHQGAEYHLRLTRNDKLILTK